MCHAEAIEDATVARRRLKRLNLADKATKGSLPLLLPFLSFHPLGEGGHEDDGRVGEEGLEDGMVPAGPSSKPGRNPPPPYGQSVR